MTPDLQQSRVEWLRTTAADMRAQAAELTSRAEEFTAAADRIERVLAEAAAYRGLDYYMDDVA
jgi:hypothetical protein